MTPTSSGAKALQHPPGIRTSDALAAIRALSNTTCKYDESLEAILRATYDDLAAAEAARIWPRFSSIDRDAHPEHVCRLKNIDIKS